VSANLDLVEAVNFYVDRYYLLVHTTEDVFYIYRLSYDM